MKRMLIYLAAYQLNDEPDIGGTVLIPADIDHANLSRVVDALYKVVDDSGYDAGAARRDGVWWTTTVNEVV